MRRLIISGAALVATAAAIALPSAASAGKPDCPPGEFCAWTDAGYNGSRFNWSGDDNWWESNIADEDSAWQNSAAPGGLDTVQVFAGAHQFNGQTICLGPGQRVAFRAGANDRGDSHQWDEDCRWEWPPGL
jgi:Peptidase inhibitor family I36